MIEVLKQALEALELVSTEFVCDGAHHAKKDRHELGEPCPIVKRYEEAIQAGKQAIAELESQEPLAWQVEVYIDGGWSPMGNPQRNKSRAEALASNPSIPKEKQRIVELYTHPPQRTEQEPEFPFGRIKATVTGPGPYKNHYPACANCNLAYATNLADDCGWACDGVSLFSKRNNTNDKETT